MHSSDEEYFRSCVAQERRLAYLLGYHNLEELNDSAGTLWHGNRPLPQWTRNWQACGPLLAEFCFAVNWADDPHHPGQRLIQIGGVTVHCHEHPNADHALRHAIVKAAIHALEHRAHPPH